MTVYNEIDSSPPTPPVTLGEEMPYDSETTLRVYWSKAQKDIMYDGPAKQDMRLADRYLGRKVPSSVYPTFDKSFFDKLEEYGYDLSTFKMSVKKSMRHGSEEGVE